MSAAADTVLVTGSSSALDGLDWSRLASPQDDGYDTTAILRMAGARAKAPSSHSCFDGSVRIATSFPFGRPLPEHCVLAGPDHPNIEQGCEWIRTWPAAFAQCQAIFEFFVPLVDERDGSAAVSVSYRFRSFAATVNHPLRLASSMVRELACQKLWVLGLRHSRALRIFRNRPEEQLQDSVATQFQSFYALLHVASLDVAILKRDGAAGVGLVRSRLTATLSKLQSLGASIRERAMPDKAGEQFLPACDAWLNAILASGREILAGPPAAIAENEANYRPRRAAGAMESTVLNELLLYVPDRDLAVSLNESARAVWELCDGATTVRQIAHRLESDLGLTEASVTTWLGVVSAVRKLHSLGVLELDPIGV